MEIIIQNTYSLYKEMVAIPEEKRAEFYEKEFIQPYRELEAMHLPFNRWKS